MNEVLFILFHKTALHIAAENGHEEIVKLLLTNPKINVDSKAILNKIFFIHIVSIFFDFQIKFQINLFHEIPK